VLTRVAVHLNSLPRRLKNALMFFPHSCLLSLSTCFQLELSRTHFSQVCSYRFTCSFSFLWGSVVVALPLAIFGLQWSPTQRQLHGRLCSSPGWLCRSHRSVYTGIQTFQLGKVLPKTAGISLGETRCKGLWGSRCGRSTAAALPQRFWAWRFSL